VRERERERERKKDWLFREIFLNCDKRDLKVWSVNVETVRKCQCAATLLQLNAYF
jgi:hypothetical protein